MYPRVEYEMSERDLEKIMDACKPVPLIMLNIGMPRSQQENANDAWAELGKKLGFDPMTVQPINGKGNRFFTAVPSETETQKQEMFWEWIRFSPTGQNILKDEYRG